MKKTLVTLLALVFVLGIASAALAAPANPFVDVPAKHWAYGAVTKLAKAGVVDGYGDGTFRGDRTMTRYEMAQIVAKAMARSEKADAEMKALIDKLAVEFAAELNNLGVRVAKLESKTNVVWGVETRVRYVSDSPPADAAELGGADNFEWRVRLHLNADVNENNKFTARVESTGTKFGSTSTQVNKSTGAVESNNALKINRAFFTTKDFLGIDQLQWGRMGLYMGQTMLVGKSSNNDGLAISHKMGDVTFKGFFADVSSGAMKFAIDVDGSHYHHHHHYGHDATVTTSNKTADVGEMAFGQFNFALDKNLDFNVGYYNNTVPMYSGAATKSKGFDAGFALGLGDFTLLGEYVATKLTNAGSTEKSSPKAFAFQLANSKSKVFYPSANIVDYKKAGTDAFAISYRSVEANALPQGVSGFEATAIGLARAAQTTDVKGYYFTYQNVVAKNIVLSLEYQDLKDKCTGDAIDKTFNVSIQAWF